MACRMGFDLTKRVGWSNFFHALRWHKRFPREMWKDTFGRVLCWLGGEHTIRQEWANGPGARPDTSCTTCCQWLWQEGYNWRVKRHEDYLKEQEEWAAMPDAKEPQPIPPAANTFKRR